MSQWRVLSTGMTHHNYHLSGGTSPRWLALFILSGGVVLAMAVWARDPATVDVPFFKCVWLAMSGWYCPGCGLTRAMHDLMHGRLREALGHNAVGVPAALVAGLLLVKPTLRALRHNHWQSPAVSGNAGWWLLAGAMLWTLVRNLPWSPLTVLAP